jgi:hypothetical protein
VKPATLQLLMRHRSIETTLKYYVEQDADEVADELWRIFSAAADPGRSELISAAAREVTFGAKRFLRGDFLESGAATIISAQVR